jgi:hypothetical protein
VIYSPLAAPDLIKEFFIDLERGAASDFEKIADAATKFSQVINPELVSKGKTILN